MTLRQIVGSIVGGQLQQVRLFYDRFLNRCAIGLLFAFSILRLRDIREVYTFLVRFVIVSFL